jgi:hypothetical protein
MQISWMLEVLSKETNKKGMRIRLKKHKATRITQLSLPIIESNLNQIYICNIGVGSVEQEFVGHFEASDP